jgi:hypothetical protein
MALSILNNIPSLAAQNQLAITGSNLQRTLFRMSSGSRINSGSDDAAGLAIADGLRANITALTQSSRNANDGVGALQVADGSLAQVTTLLNRAVTLATESATGTVSNAHGPPWMLSSRRSSRKSIALARTPRSTVRASSAVPQPTSTLVIPPAAVRARSP